jgi:hypothetical protein
VPGEPDPRIEVVWTLAQQDLTNQFAALDELRARVGSLLAAAAIATGFLSAQSFSTTNGFPSAPGSQVSRPPRLWPCAHTSCRHASGRVDQSTPPSCSTTSSSGHIRT